MRRPYHFICLLILVSCQAFSQLPISTFKVEDASKHGAYLDRRGFISGYFGLLNNSNDTLLVDRLLASTGYCNFRLLGCKELLPNEERLVLFYADIVGQYHGSLKEMLEVDETSPRTLSLHIEYRISGQHTLRHFSESIQIWPLPIAGAYCTLDSIVSVPYSGAVPIDSLEISFNTVELAKLPSMGDSTPMVEISGFLEVANTSKSQYWIKRVVAIDNRQIEIESLGDLVILRAGGSLLYAFSFLMLESEVDSLRTVIGKRGIAFSLLINVDGKDTMEPIEGTRFDWGRLLFRKSCH